MEGLPFMRRYKITHFKQRFEWDCGLSCVLMILPSSKKSYFLKNFKKICQEEDFGHSTWTIDLSYLLHRFSIRHVYYTKTIGIDPNYIQNSYYNRIIAKDQNRINMKFRKAESKGITVEQKTVENRVFLKHIAEQGPIILLTNSSLLTCDSCKLQNEQITEDAVRYTGHYVVLCGYDLLRQKFFYHNPAKDNHVCSSSFNEMDIARKAHGTDEDVIFIFSDVEN